MRYKCISCLFVLLFCFATLGSAQSTNATISGQVVDPSGRVIPEAEIQILNEATGVQYSNKTNSSGVYTVSILPPGQYRVQVSKIGFNTLIKPNIVLNVQSAVAMNFTLPLGAASESITVEAGSSTINTTDASVGTVVDRKFVENMPLNGRSFQDLISMTPGIVTQSPQSGSSLANNGDFSVNGQRTESNYYTVDGVTGNIAAGSGYGQPQNATGGAIGGGTALGTTQSLVSVDALQEFRVESSTYSAEYGRSPGGQFSLLTRSGTNRFHGSVFDYLRNDVFDANDWFNDHYGKPTPALRQNDFGGTLGGPVWIPRLYDGRDRTFFFVSYEGLRLQQPMAAAIEYVPDQFMRQQAPPAIQGILNAFPIPNGIDYGSADSPNLAQFIAPYSLPSSIDSTSIRFDQSIGPKLSLFFRYGNTPSSTSSRPNFALQTTRINSQTSTLGATSQFLSTLTNDFRLGYSTTDANSHSVADSFGGATPIDLPTAMGAVSQTNADAVMYISIAGIGTADLGVVRSTRNLGHQWNIVDTLSLTSGRHQLRIGTDIRRIVSPLNPVDPEMFAEFLSTKAVLSNLPEDPLVYRYSSATPIFNEVAFFAQDEWRATPRFSLSLGLRWEVNPPPSEAHGNNAYTLLGSIQDPSSLSLAPRGTPLWRTTWYNFAPRLGAAWTVHNPAGWETVLRAGGGVFYDNLNQLASQGFGGVGFSAYHIFTGASLPFSTSLLDFPVTATPPYTSQVVYAFPSHVQQPYTLEWNASIEQALGKPQTLTISYVGSNGRRLMGAQEVSIAKLNNNFGTILSFPGGFTSNYQALQIRFQRTVSKGIQALASYTWSHSLDFGSTGGALPLMRGNSDFDVRNNFQAGASWELSQKGKGPIAKTLLEHWGLDGRLIARTAFPVTLRGATYTDPATGTVSYAGLDRVLEQPTYLTGPQYPGSRVINKAAFQPPQTGIIGNAPRNFVRGFGATQINLALRREFPVHDALSLQFRAEAFNVLNHPNFGFVDSTYTDATFGQATQMLNHSLGTVAAQYQQGGPRSMQFALKLRF